MNKIIFLLTIFSFTSQILLAQSASEIAIKKISYRGNGCLQDTAATLITEDEKAIMLTFNNFQAEIQGRRPVTKSCTIDLDIDIPAGFRMGILGSEVKGFANLDRYVYALQTISVGINTRYLHPIDALFLRGVYADDYSNKVNVPVRNIPWSKCRDRKIKLSINTSLQLWSATRNGQGLVTVDSFEGDFGESLRYRLERCR